MRLPPQAAAALEALRREGRPLRFTVDEVCHSGRWRLSVRWPAGDGRDERLGLAYGPARAELEALRERLVDAGGDQSPTT